MDEGIWTPLEITQETMKEMEGQGNKLEDKNKETNEKMKEMEKMDCRKDRNVDTVKKRKLLRK